MFNQKIVALAKQIIDSGEGLAEQDALELAVGSPDDVDDLVSCAGRIRKHFKQNQVFACAITNAKSGMCPEDCAFCAQSAHHHTDVESYDLLSADLLESNGLEMARAGATHYSIVTSGTALTEEDIATVCNVARKLLRRTNLTLCASLGLLDRSAARQLKAAGITRYHHNLETARSFFESICTTHSYDDDIRTVKVAKDAGMAVCSGGIFGMGETWPQRVELGFTLKALDVDAVPINFLNPIKGTRLENRRPLSVLDALKTIALYRFIHPTRDITVCGGREATLNDFQSWVFAAGANGLMVGNYLTTQGRSIEMDFEMIKTLGMTTAGAQR